MHKVTYSDIAAMMGNGASMRTILKCFIRKGADIYIVYDKKETVWERYFLVKYDGLTIPLRARNLCFSSSLNSFLAQSITTNKSKSQMFAEAYGLPVPHLQPYDSWQEAVNFLKQRGALVVKPSDRAHGVGITVNVRDEVALQRAVDHASTISSQILLQDYVRGDDYRLLFIDCTFVAAVRRTPASIVGDGKQTVRELVETSNEEKHAIWHAIREQNTGGDNALGSTSKTPLEEIVQARGEKFLENVPNAGERVRLIDKANVSLGGQTEDVTDTVNKEFTEKISELLRGIDLPICGVDVMSTDIGSPVKAARSYIIEFNAAPGLRLHEAPTVGQPRPVGEMVAELLIKKYRSLDGLT